MGTLTIYGTSDDLVEVSGDVPDEEFNDIHFCDVGGVVVVSTGDQVTVSLDGDGAWQVDHTVQPTGSSLTSEPQPDAEGLGDQQGVLTTADPIQWVECYLVGQTPGTDQPVQPGRVYAAGAAPDAHPTDTAQPLP